MTDFLVPSLELVADPGPARDLWTAAAVRETYVPEDLLGKWLSAHSDAPKAHQRLATRATLDLRAVGVPAADADGRAVLKLPISQRLRVLGAVGAANASRELSAIEDTSKTATERVFGNLLGKQSVLPDGDDRLFLSALDTAARWASAAGVEIPFESGDIERHLGRMDFLRAISGPDLHRFVGRSQLRDYLRTLWRSSEIDGPPVLVEGPGGIGKSMVIGRFIADVLETDDPTERPLAVFHIDFDRHSLQRARPSTLLQEIVRQAARWWIAEGSEELLSLSREVSSGDSGLESVHANSRSIEATRDDRELARRLVDLLTGGSTGKGVRPKVIIFADSFEQVELFDYSASHSTQRVRDLLVDEGVNVFCIYASRAFANPRELSTAPPIRLEQFSVAEADIYLRIEAHRAGFEIDGAMARRVSDAVGYSPLALRLAVALLEKERTDFDTANWSELARQSPESIQAALYDRILRRLRSLELRKIALPGLLVRRLTEDVISEVLAKPCNLDLRKTRPSQLMDDARREGQLFVTDPADPGALRHRQDVRATMLANLDAAIPAETVRTINRRAVDYYAGLNDTPVYRAEELYHRLRLGQSAATLDQRWTDDAGVTLRPVMGEFPPEAQAYLRAKFGAASLNAIAAERHPPDRSAAPDDWRELRLLVRKQLQSSDKDLSALRLLQERKLDRVDGPLGDIYVQILLQQRRLDELLFEAQTLLARPSQQDDEVAASVFATAAALLEGRWLLIDARNYWVRALGAVSRASDVSALLGCLIGHIRILRKIDGPSTWREEDTRRALELVSRLQSDLYKQRVLAREVAAELSEILLHRGSSSDEMNIHRLVGFVLETNEAFPSAVDDPRRLRELGHRLVGARDLRSLNELNDAMAKLIYNDDPGVLATIVQALRAEVDWSLARPWQAAEPNTVSP